jgi:hypothetical protein
VAVVVVEVGVVEVVEVVEVEVVVVIRSMVLGPSMLVD